MRRRYPYIPIGFPVKRLADNLAHAFDQRPESFFLVVLAVQAVLWFLAPVLTYSNAPVDIVENLAWGREWQLGYASHPPLQAWLSMGAVWLAGNAIWPIFVLSQIAMALTYLPLYLLGREAGGARVGLFAVLIFSLVFYANWPTPEFNANVLQMPIWAFATWELWRALKTERLIWWLTFGFTCALAAYAKYSAVILFAALLLASVAIPEGRRAYRTVGPYLAVALALALLVPHLWWLWSADFLPIRYVEDRAGRPEGFDRITRLLSFSGAQILDHLLPAVVLLASGIGFRSINRQPLADRSLWRFILVMAFAPYAVTLLFALLSGYGLRDMWAAPMPIWISLVAAILFLPVVRRLPGFLFTWAVVFALLPVLLGVVTVASRYFPHPLWAAWPGSAMADALGAAWKQNTGGAPLRIAAGDRLSAGLMGALYPEHPHVMTRADFRLSPWVTPEELERDGALFVWYYNPSDGVPPEYTKFGPFKAIGTVQIRFPGPDSAAIGWAVKAPAGR